MVIDNQSIPTQSIYVAQYDFQPGDLIVLTVDANCFPSASRGDRELPWDDDPKDKMKSRPIYRFGGRAVKRGEAVTAIRIGGATDSELEIQACLQ